MLNVYDFIRYENRIDFINSELDASHFIEPSQIDAYLIELEEIEALLEKSIEEGQKQLKQERLSKFKVINGGRMNGDFKRYLKERKGHFK